MTEAPLTNSPEARTEDGTLKDLTTPSTEPTTNEPAPGESPKAEPTGAPEAYTAFTAPEGIELDSRAIEQASPIFKELGLNQAQAQKLVDVFNDISKARADGLLKAVSDLRADWVKQVSADPEIGSKLDDVRAQVGRMLNSLGDPKLVADFKAAMDLTGAGDNPAFIKAFYRLAQRVNEGTHVSGGGPSPEGQRAPGVNPRPSLAASMYPNLPH